MKHPDPKRHQQISFVKSAIRMLGFVSLVVSVPYGALLLVIAECIGIYEELV